MWMRKKQEPQNADGVGEHVGERLPEREARIDPGGREGEQRRDGAPGDPLGQIHARVDGHERLDGRRLGFE